MPPYFHRRPKLLDAEKYPAGFKSHPGISPASSTSSYDFGSDTDSPLLISDTRPRSRFRLRPRLALVLCSLIGCVTFLLLGRPNGPSLLGFGNAGSEISPPSKDISEFTPTGRFRGMSLYEFAISSSHSIPLSGADALDPNEKYITSFLIAGWTNDVIAIMHMLLIALHTRRIPVIPPFQPSHAPYESGFIKFSDVFSIPRLSESLNLTILEWTDIKDTHSDPPRLFYEEYYGGETEEIGCWSLWMTQMARGNYARSWPLPDVLNLSVSFTPVPFGYKNQWSLDINIHYLSSLGLGSARELAIAESKATYLGKMQETIDELPEEKRPLNPPSEVPVPNGLGSKIDPDDQMLCFDYLYFATPYVENQRNPSFDPDWELIGKHMRFSDSFTALSTQFLLASLSLPEASPPSPLPPLITVHIRRQDFVKNCRELSVPVDECLAPLSAYIRRVEEVRSDMLNAHPEWTADDIKVVVLSDEPRTSTKKSIEEYGFLPGSSEAWWKTVNEQGWFSIDHDALETIKKYGEWYPIIVDACILSMGHGFVGTDASTYSIISGQRVAEWQGGPTRTVKWGKKGADDH